MRETIAVLIAALLAGIILAAPLGVRAAGALRKDWLKRIYAAMLFGIAANVVFRMLG